MTPKRIQRKRTRGGLVWNDEAQKCVWNADAVTIEYKALGKN